MLHPREIPRLISPGSTNRRPGAPSCVPALRAKAKRRGTLLPSSVRASGMTAHLLRRSRYQDRAKHVCPFATPSGQAGTMYVHLRKRAGKTPRSENEHGAPANLKARSRDSVGYRYIEERFFGFVSRARKNRGKTKDARTPLPSFVRAGRMTTQMRAEKPQASPADVAGNA